MGAWALRGLAGVLAAAALAAIPASAGAVSTPPFADGDGLHLASAKALDSRLFAVTVTTDRLTAPANVQILLPADYDQHPDQRYPVLYLFHGTSGGASDWTRMGEAEKTTDGRPLIVVMPDAGVNSNGGSWFTNWYNGGKWGPPEWETFHIEQLIPWIDANLRTVADRNGRAIFGLSQGGFGALSYAARHPDTFGTAGSFSGADDIAANPAIADPLVTPVVNATEVFLDGVPPNTFFGDRATQELNWAAHDPATLTSNLRWTNLYAYTGDGRPGPLDTGAPNPGASGIEWGVHELTQLFRDEVVKRGIPIDYHDYGPGTHTWPYWTRDLQEVIGPVMDDFAHPTATPRAIEYASADDRWQQWGWSVAFQRPAREFSTLSNAGARGFTLAGSGAATVLTPPFYRPGARLIVVVGGVRRVARADSTGRLTVAVPLGPGNPAQQSTPGAQTRVYETTVKVAAQRSPRKRGGRAASAQSSNSS
jgi:S-formylglutathione hydrolase FrmB